MNLKANATKGGGSLAKLATIYHCLEDDFKQEIMRDCGARPLFYLLEIADDSHNLPKLLEIVFEYYDLTNHVFNFGGHTLGITLEDVVCVTGLPIQGDALVPPKRKERNVFTRVLGDNGGTRDQDERRTIPQLKEIVLDKNKTFLQRKIALLVIIIHYFISPSYGGNVYPTYVYFVEQMDKVGSYSWGAALLAHLYCGLESYNAGGNQAINGNLWIVLAFLLLRIPGLRDAIGINLDLENCVEPLLGRIVKAVKKISKNRYLDYTQVKNVIENLNNDGIVWRPYDSFPLTPQIQEQRRYGTMLVPIMCIEKVAWHRPHLAAKQFGVFEQYDLSTISWKIRRLKRKRNTGPDLPDLQKWYTDYINEWNVGRMAYEYMVRVIAAPTQASTSTTP